MVFYWSIQAYIVKIQFLFFPIVGRKTKIREVWYLSNLTPPTPPQILGLKSEHFFSVPTIRYFYKNNCENIFYNFFFTVVYLIHIYNEN